jgi:hypothetical protein
LPDSLARQSALHCTALHCTALHCTEPDAKLTFHSGTPAGTVQRVIFCQFWLYFMNLNHVLKKLVEVGAMTYFQIDVNGISMLWGIQK